MASRAFLVLWFAMFVGTAGIGMVSPLLPVFAKDLGATGVWLGLAFSGFALTQGTITPFIGRVSDRLGRKPFIFAGLLVYAAAGLAYLLATTYWQIILIRLCSGVGTAFIFPVTAAYVGEMAPPQREGAYMGTFAMAQTIGFGSGPLLGGVLRDALGIDAVFLAMGGSTLVAAALVFLLLPVVPRQQHREAALPAAPVVTVLKHPTVLAVLIFQAVWAVGNGAALAFAAILMDEKLAASGTAIGLVLSARTLTNGFLQPFSGRLADRYSRVLLVALGLTAAALTTFTIPLAGSIPALLALFALLGAFESVSYPSAMAMVVDAGRELGMGSTMGLLQMSLAAGITGGSAVGGAVESSFGVDAVFRYAAGMSLLGVALFGLMASRARAVPAAAAAPAAVREQD